MLTLSRANDAPSLPLPLDGEKKDADMPSYSNGPIENEAKWLDEGQLAELTKRTPSSKILEVMALKVHSSILPSSH